MAVLQPKAQNQNAGCH